MGTSYNFLNDPFLIDDSIVAKRHYGRFRIRDGRHWKIKLNSKDVPISWLQDMSPKGMHLKVGIREDIEVGQIVPVVIRLQGEDFFRSQAVVRWKAISETAVNMVEVGLEFVNQDEKPAYAWQPTEGLVDYLESVKAQKPEVQKAPSRWNLLSKLTSTEMLLITALPLILGIISTL